MFPTKLITYWLLIVVSNGVISQEYYDNAERIFQDFLATVQTSVDFAQQDFVQLEQRVTYYSLGTLGETESYLADTAAYLERQVLNLREEFSERDPETIDHCVTSYEDEIKRLPDYALAQISDCVNTLVHAAREDIQKGRESVLNSFATGDILRADLDGCRVASDERECVSRVTIEILLQSLEVPTEISEIIRRTKDTSGISIQEIPSCLRERREGTQQVADLILRFIRNCLEAE